MYNITREKFDSLTPLQQAIIHSVEACPEPEGSIFSAMSGAALLAYAAATTLLRTESDAPEVQENWYKLKEIAKELSPEFDFDFNGEETVEISG